MTPVIVALFDDFGAAEQVRTQLVADGFPTDRVELTSPREAGQADTEPGSDYRERLSAYFHTLFDQADEPTTAERFADRVRHGDSVITVHPRTDYEIDSARSILKRHHPVEVREQLGS